MKKIISCLLLLAVFVSGCTSVKQVSGKEYDFTVVTPEDVPEELQKEIEEQKVNPFQISMTCEEYLYIAIGYGEQESGGYSIQVEHLREKGENLCIATSLIGPEENKVVKKKKSYPYIVVKTESIDKNIVYE